MNGMFENLKFPEIEGVDVQAGLLMNRGIVCDYLKALNAFCFDVDEKAQELSFCIRKKDLNLYITIVHAFENAAVKIGAVMAADFANKLKNAYESESIAFIIQNNKNFVSHLLALQKNIRFALKNGFSEISKACEGDIDHLNTSLIKIKKALKMMAIGEAKTIISELKTMKWQYETQNAITNISRHILLFEYEKAVKLIDLIIPEKRLLKERQNETSC